MKKLRTSIYLDFIKMSKLKTPKIDLPTRWNSTFDMLLSLKDLKEFVIAHEKKNPELKLSQELWTFVDAFLEVFALVKTATLKFQTEQFTYGDFYGEWLKIILDIEPKEDELSKLLLSSMKRREINLTGSDIFKAAIYLDPRYRVMIEDDPKKLLFARRHLKKTFLKMKELNGEELENSDSNNRLEMFLASKKKSNNQIFETSSKSVFKTIDNFNEPIRLNIAAKISLNTGAEKNGISGVI